MWPTARLPAVPRAGVSFLIAVMSAALAPPLVPAFLALPAIAAEAILSARLTYQGPDADPVVAPGEDSSLLLEVTNHGGAPARELRAVLHAEGDGGGLELPGQILIGDLAPGETRRLSIPLVATDVRPGSLAISARVAQYGIWERAIARATVRLSSVSRWGLEIEPAARIRSLDSAAAKPGSRIALAVRVRNPGPRVAGRAKLQLVSKDPLILLVGAQRQDLGALGPGQSAWVPFEIFLRHDYSGAPGLALEAALVDSAGKPVKTVKLLALLDTARVDPQTALVRPVSDPPPPPAPGWSDEPDIERDLPERQPDPDALAVVVGVDHYPKLVSCAHAERSARWMREYFVHAVGMPRRNVIERLGNGASLSAVRTALFTDLVTKVRARQGRSSVYVYLSGHGFPGPGGPYFAPWDADPDKPGETAIAVDEILKALADLPSANVTAFFDVSFSGTTTVKDEVVSVAKYALARPAPRVVTRVQPPPGITVFWACRPDEIARQHPSQPHRLFSYHVMRGLKGAAASWGKVTAAGLADYLAKSVHGQRPDVDLDRADRILGGK